MRNKLLLCIGVFILGCVGLWAINYYVYSWIGFSEALIGICENKQVGLTNSASSRGISLEEIVDLNKLAKETRLNSEYRTDLRGDYALYLERIIEGKLYHLLLENRTLADSTWFQLYENQQEQSIKSCQIPNYRLLRNSYKFIDDLPITEKQKSRMKANIKISTTIQLSLG
jgi:hypothetical protein